MFSLTEINEFDFRCIDLLLANINHPVFVVGNDYKIYYANELAKKLTFNGQEVLGESIFHVFQGLNTENSLIVKTMKSGKAIIDELHIWTSNIGEKRLSVTSAFPIIEKGKVLGVMELTEPLSNLDKRFKNLLMENKDSFNMIVDNQQKRKTNLYTVDDIIGKSDSVQKMRKSIILASNSSANLLIYGETGSGKELVAQAVHSFKYKGAKAPFVAQNCAAIPETLLESILFGTTKGAFTGAENSPGLFELANNGTLFLDELNSMPINLQAKLLRILQDKKVRRLGSDYDTKINTRLIAAINESPDILIKNGLLREDLFYMIGVIYISVEPLRERKEDIPILLKYFIDKFNKHSQKKIVGFDRRCLDFFTNYAWPGNIRELRNIVERACTLSTDKVVSFSKEELIPYNIYNNHTPEKINTHIPNEPFTLKQIVEKTEIEVIKNMLENQKGNIARTARQLDVPTSTLHNKINKYRLRDYARKILSKYKK
ncbi:MAG: sigma 54-interacting transcriptional regulator [Firmicutes bacterium]|nr:sigma 54-interacting transcriptional regulator [Bacillota bacterium]